MFEARTSELGSCQSNLWHSRGYERFQKSKDSLKACFENESHEIRINNVTLVNVYVDL